MFPGMEVELFKNSSLAALGRSCWRFSLFVAVGLLFFMVHGFLTAVASLVLGTGLDLQTRVVAAAA